jgi:lysophospholipase L1-like esterase
MKFMKKSSVNVGLLAISIFVSLVLLELLTGYIYERLPERFNNGKRLVEIYIGNNSSILGSIEQHPYLLYQNTRNYHADGFKQNNSYGYRGKEFDLEKMDTSIRILALGGSTTYMYPYIKNPNNTWVSQLEAILKEKISPNIETINAGLSSATTAELLSSYVFRHKYLKPDILIIHTGGNDVVPLLFENYNPEYTHYRAAGSGHKPRRFESKLLSKSNLFKLFYSIWLNWNHSVYQEQPYALSLIDRENALDMVKKNNSSGFRRNLDTLIKIAKSDNVKVVLFAFLQAREENLTRNRKDIKGLEKAAIEGLDKHYRIMKDLADKYDIPLIIPAQSLFDDSWFIDNCHLNEQGEYMKATILSNHFINSKKIYFADVGK